MLLGVATSTAAAPGHEDPAWYSFRSDTLTVQVANIAEVMGERVPLSDFAPMVGAGYAKSRGTPTEYLAFPLILSRPPNAAFTVLCGRRTYRAENVQLVHSEGGKWYAVAIFEAAFRLKDITGFRYGASTLTLESKLK